MGQRLGREQVQRAGSGIVEQRVEHGQAVGQRLAGGSGGGQDNVLPRQRRLDRLGLVGVGLFDGAIAGGGDQARVEPGRPGGDTRGPDRDALPGGHAAHKGRVLPEISQDIGKHHGRSPQDYRQGARECKWR